MQMGQYHYLPLAPGFFAILVGIFVIVLILRSVHYAYESLGVSSGTAIFLLFATLVGSIFNIPVAELPPERIPRGDPLLWHALPGASCHSLGRHGHRSQCRRRGTHRVAYHGYSGEYLEYMKSQELKPGRGTAIGRAALDGQIVIFRTCSKTPNIPGGNRRRSASTGRCLLCRLCVRACRLGCSV